MTDLIKTDGGDYILDDTLLLEPNEIEQLGFDIDENGDLVDSLSAAPRNYMLNIFPVSDKEVRKRYHELLESVIQTYLDDKKRGHTLKKIEEIVQRKATAQNYYESIVALCAVSAKIKSLSAYAEREESAPKREQVDAKIEKLENLEDYLLKGIDNYSQLLCGDPTDLSALRRETRGRDSRDVLRRKLREDFVNDGKVELV